MRGCVGMCGYAWAANDAATFVGSFFTAHRKYANVISTSSTLKICHYFHKFDREILPGYPSFKTNSSYFTTLRNGK